MKKLLLLLLLTIPITASAYGTRAWLSEHKGYGWKSYNKTKTWGYNYRSLGRHTTVRDEEDVTGWMYNGNLRNSTDAGIFHWKKASGGR